MTVPNPADVAARCRRVAAALDRLADAYGACHGDAYELQASHAAEGAVRPPAGTHSDPVGERLLDDARLADADWHLRAASNALDAAHAAIDRALFDHLWRYRYATASAPRADRHPDAITNAEYLEARAMQAKRRGA